MKLLLTFETVYMHMEEIFRGSAGNLQTRKDITTRFEKGKFLQQKEDRNKFKKALEIMIDLAKKSEIYIYSSR